MSRFSATDKLFRQVILAERPNRCERCHKTCPVGVAHILPKGTHPRLRYKRCNVLLLCWHCHLEWAHKNPLEFNEWVEEYKGKELLNSLRIMERELPRTDLKMIALCLKEQLRELTPKD